MMPSIQAVAGAASSIEGGVGVEAELVVIRPGGGTAFERTMFLSLSGGNKGRPEKPHTAGRWDWLSLQLVAKLVDGVEDKNPETDTEADPADVIAVKFVEEGNIEVIVE